MIAADRASTRAACDDFDAIASMQTVTVAITNATLEDRYLVLSTTGDECDLLSIYRVLKDEEGRTP